MAKAPVFISTDRGNVVPFPTLHDFAIKVAEGEEKSQGIPTDAFKGQYGVNNLVRPPHDPDVIMGLLDLNTWHNRCVEVKAGDTANLGHKIEAVEGTEEHEEETPEGTAESKVKEFFSEPFNNGRTVDQVLTDCQTDKEAVGYMAIEVVRELYDPYGFPVLLSHLPAQSMRAHKDGNKYCQKQGIATRWFKRFGYGRDVNKEDGSEHDLGSLDPDLRASEIIWDKFHSARSDYYGRPQVLPAVGAIEGMVSLRDYNIDFFRNYGIPTYAIYITGDYDLGDMVRVRKESDGSGTIGEVYDPSNPDMTISCFEYKIISEVKRNLANIAANPHSPIILAVPGVSPDSTVTLDFKPLTVEMKEASFRLYRKDNRDEIIVAHGVPSYRLGLVEMGSLGGNTATESNRIYRDSVIRPRKNSMEVLINLFVIQQGFGVKSLRFKLNPLDIIEEDHAQTDHEKGVADFLFARGAMTPRELRTHFGEMFSLEEAPEFIELDSYYLNGQPIQSLGGLPAEEDSFASSLKGLTSDLLKVALDDKEVK